MLKLTLLGAVLGLTPLLIPPAQADVVVAQSVIAGGIGVASNAEYIAEATLGQPVIGGGSGGGISADAGFWYPSTWVWTSVEEPESGVPKRFELFPSRPNPFNPVTTLVFTVPRPGRVSLVLYDVRGREVRTVVDDVYGPGTHEEVLDADGLPSGVYFCRMTADRFEENRKIVLLK
ncbi:MAG: T9SS type A sorting domain-containing protein [Candidatus Eisenbacteria bacterium]